ncbi:hypothetical protein C8R44DRAFT_876268 [Mycena epipterygia]|nr:hypothetical protein C8R44DRAFT_876268 [Mycena epipterygia]
MDGQLENLTLLPALPHLRALALRSSSSITWPDRTLVSAVSSTLGLRRRHKYLVPFLARSSPAGLRELWLHNSYDSFIESLRFMPALAKLKIDGMDADNIRITDDLYDEGDENMDYEVVANTIETLKNNALRSFPLTWNIRDEEHIDKNDFEEKIGLWPTFNVL